MKKPSNIKIVLNAMVGNEENTITRMLESVDGYVDYYVIQCNGMKDKTKDIIDAFFAERGIPGITYEIPWEFPGKNRDHTLQKCINSNHGCDWILRMDADEQLEVEDDFDWTVFEDLSIDSFNMVADPGDTMYFRTWMWNAHREWYFTHDQRHETIHLPIIDEGFSRVDLPKGFRHIITNDGETWDVPMKFLSDALTLEKDKVPSNLVLEDDYHLWYIGKSYSDCYGNPDELPFGKVHSDEYARRAIFYFTMFLDKLHNFSETGRAAGQDEMSYYAMLLIGNAYNFIGDTEKAITYYKKASEFNFERNEAMYHLIEIMESEGRYEDMLRYTSDLTATNRKNPFPKHSFMIGNYAYWDTSCLPFWLHIKALQYNNESNDLVQIWIDKMMNIHPETPDGILNDFKTEELNQEYVAVLEPEVKNESANILSGVFGITR